MSAIGQMWEKRPAFAVDDRVGVKIKQRRTDRRRFACGAIPLTVGRVIHVVPAGAVPAASAAGRLKGRPRWPDWNRPVREATYVVAAQTSEPAGSNRGRTKKTSIVLAPASRLRLLAAFTIRARLVVREGEKPEISFEG